MPSLPIVGEICHRAIFFLAHTQRFLRLHPLGDINRVTCQQGFISQDNWKFDRYWIYLELTINYKRELADPNSDKPNVIERIRKRFNTGEDIRYKVEIPRNVTTLFRCNVTT